ncbi:MAG: hypothetical protein ABRQ39_06930 [Candidatus Eremiobacterota bacterium]
MKIDLSLIVREKIKKEPDLNRDEPDISFCSALAIRLIAAENSNSN